jgi:hypothetical protein
VRFWNHHASLSHCDARYHRRRQDRNRHVSTWTLSHRLCLCDHHSYSPVTESYEVRSDSSSPLSPNGTLTHAERDQIYCIFSLEYIWDCSHIFTDHWQDHTLCDHRLSHYISHRDPRKGEEKIIKNPSLRWIFYYFATNRSSTLVQLTTYQKFSRYLALALR